MQKRAVLTAVGQEKDEMDLLPGCSKKSAEKKKKTCDKPIPTIRFQIDLFQPTKYKFKEVNYQDLLRDHNRPSSDKSKNGDENNEDEDAVRTARYYEEKYGNKRRSGWEDYVDKGMGYDETDPFIDNDEAYDELIPSSLTTKHGGFYVNTGQLDFKPAPVSDQPDESCERTGANACPRIPVIKRRKSSNNSHSGSHNIVVKKKKKDHNQQQVQQSEQQKTVAQMIDQKRQNQNRDRVSPDEFFPQPVRRNRPVIDDDDDEVGPAGAITADTPCSVDDVIDCVARGRANGSQSQKQVHALPVAQTEKQSVVRMAGESAKSESGLAMNSLARMVSSTGRVDNERSSTSNGHQQPRNRPTDLSQHSSRPADVTPSPGFKQHPGLIDHPQHKSPSASSSSSSLLANRTPVSAFPQTSHNNKFPYDRSSNAMRMQSQTSPSQAADPQTKQSPTSAQIRSSFQSVIKTSVDPKKSSESATMDSLMEKVISNSLQKYPNSNSTPFTLPSPTSQLPGKNFKTPPAAHQQPKNNTFMSFLEPASRTHSHLDTMILEHLNNDSKGLTSKTKSDSSLTASDAASHAKVVKFKDQYRIPNLPVGPKLHHSSSSNRPNSVPTPPVGKQSQSVPQQHRGHPQKSSPPAAVPTASSPSPSSSSSQQKLSQPKSVHANRSSPHARHSPHTPEPMSQFNPVMHSPMAWNAMAMFTNPSLFHPAVSSGMSMTGMSQSLSRPVIPVAQGPSLPPDPFLNMHTYAAPPGGKGET